MRPGRKPPIETLEHIAWSRQFDRETGEPISLQFVTEADRNDCGPTTAQLNKITLWIIDQQAKTQAAFLTRDALAAVARGVSLLRCNAGQWSLPMEGK